MIEYIITDYGYGTVFHIESDMVDVMFDNIYYTKYLQKIKEKFG